jgi:cytochrome c5
MRLSLHAATGALVLAMLSGCSQVPGAGAAGASAPAARQMADAGRGQLLYETACAECHSEQVHWREKRLVHDWPSLVYQVARWQKNAGQHWGTDEIEDVAAYLNRRLYRMPCPVAGCAPERIGAATLPKPRMD